MAIDCGISQSIAIASADLAFLFKEMLRDAANIAFDGPCFARNACMQPRHLLFRATDQRKTQSFATGFAPDIAQSISILEHCCAKAAFPRLPLLQFG
jgi:hypothetical protein